MKITDVPFAVLRFQYQLARLPLQVLGEQVVGRIGEEEPARLLFERSLGRLDIAVGSALGAPEWQRRGEALVERSEALARAARLDVAADRTVKEADAELKDARDAAALVREEAGADKVDTITKARAKTAHQKVAAVNEAQDRVAAVEKRTDKAAAARKDAVEADKRRQQEKIHAAEETATAVAEAKTEDAQQKRGTAAAKRAHAESVDKLKG
jgi:hypothetical protein